MPVTDWGEVKYDLAPLIRAVRDILPEAWTYRLDPESDTTRVVREGAPAFPAALAEAVMQAATIEPFGPGYTNRVVLSCVPAGCRILPHTDDFGDAVRSASRHCHIPLITDPAAVMGFPDDDVITHLQTGRLYAIDETRRHYVENPSHIDRVHLLFAHFPHAGLPEGHP